MVKRETLTVATPIAGAQPTAARQTPHTDSRAESERSRENLLRELPSLELEALERETIREAIRRSGGKQLLAAQFLGISRFALRRKMKRYGLFLRRRRTDREDGAGGLPRANVEV